MFVLSWMLFFVLLIFYPLSKTVRKYKKISIILIILMMLSYSKWSVIFSAKFSISAVLISILGGGFSYYLSWFIVNKKIKMFDFSMLLGIPKSISKVKIKILFSILLSCLVEEILWRGIIQYSLGNSILAVLITSIFFVLSHYRRKFYYLQMVDLFIFSLILGIVYSRTQNIYYVMIIHVTRNLLVHIDGTKE